ncbi:MAG: response regulator transcription factor [Lachnospiraceae bacterium]|nr:response regulator transcription factor [Lachnospiraceae bacterium]
MKKKILIIEDDIIIRKELQVLLNNQGYEIEGRDMLKDVREEMQAISPQLVLLDISLPEKNGYDICTEIRSFSKVPIIFVTSKNTMMDELNSIMLGGDDFITKPYNIPILLARVNALLRRAYQDQGEEIIEYQGIKLFVERNLVSYQDKEIELSKTEFRILLLLMKNPKKIVSRMELIEDLWQNRTYIDDNSLSVNMTRVREKLGRIDVRDFIHTKHKQGYCI